MITLLDRFALKAPPPPDWFKLEGKATVRPSDTLGMLMEAAGADGSKADRETERAAAWSYAWAQAHIREREKHGLREVEAGSRAA